MRLLLCALTAGLLVAQAEAAPLPPEKGTPDIPTLLAALNQHPRCPFTSRVWQGSVDENAGVPVVALGRLPAEAASLVSPPGNRPARSALSKAREELLDPYLRGRWHLLPPVEGERVQLLLYGPAKSKGEMWRPARLSRDGNTLTLLLEGWSDARGRGREGGLCPVVALDLEPLPAGEYTLRLLWRAMNDSTEDTLLRWDRSRVARLGFAVARPDERVPLETRATLKEDAFKESITPGAETERRWQRTLALTKEVTLEKERDGQRKLGLSAGVVEMRSWAQKSPWTEGNIPTLAAPAFGSMTGVMLTGPVLHSGERLAVSGVEWKKRDNVNVVIVHAEVWRDEESRRRNQPYLSLMMVPLLSQGRGLIPVGDYQVQIHWTLLHARTNREPYVLVKPGKKADERWAPILELPQEVKFKLSETP